MTTRRIRSTTASGDPTEVDRLRAEVKELRELLAQSEKFASSIGRRFTEQHLSDLAFRRRVEKADRKTRLKVVEEHLGISGRGRGRQYDLARVLGFYAQLTLQWPPLRQFKAQYPVFSPSVDDPMMITGKGTIGLAYVAPVSRPEAIRITAREYGWGVTKENVRQCRKRLREFRDGLRKRRDAGTLPNDDAWLADVELPSPSDVDRLDSEPLRPTPFRYTD